MSLLNPPSVLVINYKQIFLDIQVFSPKVTYEPRKVNMYSRLRMLWRIRQIHQRNWLATYTRSQYGQWGYVDLVYRRVWNLRMVNPGSIPPPAWTCSRNVKCAWKKLKKARVEKNRSGLFIHQEDYLYAKEQPHCRWTTGEIDARSQNRWRCKFKPSLIFLLYQTVHQKSTISRMPKCQWTHANKTRGQGQGLEWLL